MHDKWSSKRLIVFILAPSKESLYLEIYECNIWIFYVVWNWGGEVSHNAFG